jgi:hypothetical protein
MDQVESITLPPHLVAGDSFAAVVSPGDFPPADGWSAKIIVVGGAFREQADATVVDGEFRFAIAAADTADWTPGRYNVFVAFSKGAERYTLGAGSFDVRPDPLAASVTNFDTRSAAQKIVEAIDAWMQGKAGWAGEKQIGDRRIKDHPLPELLQVRSHYATIVAGEQAAANLAAGIPNTRGRVNVQM